MKVEMERRGDRGVDGVGKGVGREGGGEGGAVAK